MSKCGNVVVQSSTDFFSQIKDLMPSIKIFLLNQVDIDVKLKKDNPQENIKDISGIKRMPIISGTMVNLTFGTQMQIKKTALPDLTVSFHNTYRKFCY